MMLYVSFANNIPRLINLLCLLRGHWKKISQFLANTVLSKIIFFCVITSFLLAGYNQSLRPESNFILFCILNYVTYIIIEHNCFIGKYCLLCS